MLKNKFASINALAVCSLLVACISLTACSPSTEKIKTILNAYIAGLEEDGPIQVTRIEKTERNLYSGTYSVSKDAVTAYIYPFTAIINKDQVTQFFKDTDENKVKVLNKQTGMEVAKFEAVGNHVTVYLDEPGTLYKRCRKYFDHVDTDQEYGEDIWGNITSVTIYGTIDARDFSTLKWNFRNIKDVDLSGTEIAAYRGKYGTNEGYYDGSINSTYRVNEVPVGAFFYWQRNYIRTFPDELNDEGMVSLRSVKLPKGVKTICRNAFARAYNLKEITIPEGVETIEMVAFRYCMSVEKLYLPSTLKNVGWLAFTEMSSLKEVHIAAPVMPTEDKKHNPTQTFGNRLDASQIEGVVGQLWRGWILAEEGNGIDNDKTNAVLYVPAGAKNNYKEWDKYFVRIEEE